MPEHTEALDRMPIGGQTGSRSAGWDGTDRKSPAVRLKPARHRWWVHLGMMVTLVVSLVFETVLTIHIVVGLVFVALALTHVTQRRLTSGRLAAKLLRVRTLGSPVGRMAVADALLAALSLAMLGTGFWDLFDGHPTRIRWHALTGVALAVFLVVHTVRRRKRLRSSRVR